MERKKIIFETKDDKLPTFENFIINEGKKIGGKDADDVATEVYDKLPDSVFNWSDEGSGKDDKLNVGKETNDAIASALKGLGYPSGKAVVGKIRAEINRGMK